MNMQRRLVFGVASLAALYAGVGQALGLGELQLQSALNQPLQAIIQLQGSEGVSPSDVTVSLADAETFARLGIERPFFLTDLRFTPMLHNQQLIIRVESSRPVREPYLNFLVQVMRPHGSLLREYTLLLDPPLYEPVAIMASSSQRVVDAMPQSSNTAPARSVSSGAAARQIPVDVINLPALQPQPDAPRYQTVVGDSLWGIASTTRVNSSVSVQRQMDAIRALNPHAFVNGDPDRLRSGQELTLPTTQQVGAVSATPQPAGTREATVQQPTAEPARQRNDRLRIEEPTTQMLSEESEALQNRLDMLEARFQGLLGELELRNAQIASLQAELDIMRQSRSAQQQSEAGRVVTAASEQNLLSNEQHLQQIVPSEQGSAGEPGTVEATEWTEQDNRDNWLTSWWPALLALLAILSGALWLRVRREPEQSPLSTTAIPVPQSISVSSRRGADPLEGVELYLTYGRLAEAQLMLEKAIAREPQRVDLRMRLLAVLAELGDGRGFTEQEHELGVLGADQMQIDHLKARYPQLQQARQQDTVDPLEKPREALWHESATLDLDDFELEQSWELLDELDGLNDKRKGAAQQVDQPFESNLQDFPEVAEMNDVQAQQLGSTEQLDNKALRAAKKTGN